MATTKGQYAPGSNDDEQLFRIFQIFMSTASPFDGLVTYPGNSSVGGLTSLQIYCWFILQPQPIELTIYCVILLIANSKDNARILVFFSKGE